MNTYIDKEYKIFKLFASGLAVAMAGNKDKHNACTIGWGSLGTIWTGKNGHGQIVTIYIHPDRYTSNLINDNDYFTVSFFDEKYRKKLGYLGSVSGRNEDKTKGSGLSLLDLDKTVTYKEAHTIFVCRKLYEQEFSKDGLVKDVKDYYINNPRSFPLDENGDWHSHIMYIGEIVDVIENN